MAEAGDPLASANTTVDTARTAGGVPRVPDAGPDFSIDLAEVEALDLGDLRVRYRTLTRKAAPAHLPRWLILRIVAYQLQARVLGDLDTETVKLLAGLARGHEKALRARTKAAAAGEVLKKPVVPDVPAVTTRGKLAIGTEFVREFGGELHRVLVVEDGFGWKGRTFTSLSQIAKLITGTNWNGPYFFGLRDRAKAEEVNRDTAASGKVTRSGPRSEPITLTKAKGRTHR